ncbi:hypothetical protein QAD02_000537 [Eretmocerus hayati]|uniref:Uncharacterized protein n=1 Tax=Eretmocerus hayati TaxID=131215 RepID=A0ACC2NDQ7_9HYME|nr:hypothetical protein QAD02_000537 [Eretmocerus hayati]
MEIVQYQEKEKGREDTIKELIWRLEETEKRTRRNNIIIHGKIWQRESIRNQIQVWIKEKLELDVSITRCWIIKGQEKAHRDLTFKGRNLRRKLKEKATELSEKGKRTLGRDDTINIEGTHWKRSERDQNIVQTSKIWKGKGQTQYKQ